MELRDGMTIPIPCRHCSRFVPITLWGFKQEIRCPNCSKRTLVTSYYNMESIRLKTAPLSDVSAHHIRAGR